MNEQIEEEIEVLRSIYPSEDEIVVEGNTCEFHLPDSELWLVFTLPAGYPDEGTPAISLKSTRAASLPPGAVQLFRDALKPVAEMALGGPHLFDLITAATEFMAENAQTVLRMLSEYTNVAHGKIEEVVEEEEQVKWWLEPNGSGDADMVEEMARLAAVHRREGRWVAGMEELRRAVGTEDGSGKEWKYVIGLVGKPSSGKSTFFNAVCGLLGESSATMARMAAHPFTTLEPNMGSAYAIVQCPCRGYLKCEAPFGHARISDPEERVGRVIPVIVKDVAGLVPGAYLGRGRGNKFLDDLNDADVLIHVVDASGETDSEGRSIVGIDAADLGSDADPAEDVCWIRSEIHRWIFDNVKAKWDKVRKSPEFLARLFSGYHADNYVVQTALRAAGVYPNTYEFDSSRLTWDKPVANPLPVQDWDERVLHYVVAHFLRERFPILLALNKADTASALKGQHVQRVKERWPYETSVAVSARGELLLQQLRIRELVKYTNGGNSFALTKPMDVNAQEFIDASFAAGMRAEGTETEPVESVSEVAAALRILKNNAFGKYGCTGVVNALYRAVGLRKPAVGYPVADLSTKMSLDAHGPLARHVHPGILKDCVLLKQGCTVCDLFHVIKREKWKRICGDYSCAETESIDGKTRTMAHKDDELNDDNCVVMFTYTRHVAVKKK